MTTASLLPGNRFRLYRGTPDALAYVALATTLSLTTETATSDRATIGDPWMNAAPGVRSWAIEFSGRADATAFRMIEADEAAGRPMPYRILVDTETPRTYDGRLFITKLTRSTAERGFVEFQATCKGTGALAMT